MALIASSPGSAKAGDTAPTKIEIAPSTLPQALAELSRKMNVSIGTQGSLPLTLTPPVRGRLSIEDALAKLLAGSGFVARKVGLTAWRVERPTPVTVAAPQPPPDEPPPPPIIVTAGKREELLNALPLAVSVLRLQERGSSSTEQGTTSVASEVEGLAVTGLGPGRNRMFVRGIADSAFNGESQATVAVVFDEARLTYSAPDPDIRLVDIERVEVLKGPQGSLYGSGALGGIYHIVSRSADLDRFSAQVATGGELVAHGGAGLSASAIANLPLIPEKLGLRFVAYDIDEPGWVDTGTRKASNRTHVSGVRANLGAQLGDDWRLDLKAFGQWLDSLDSSYVYARGARSRPAQLPEPHHNDIRHASIRLERDSGPIHILASTGLTWHKVDDLLDATIGAEGFGLPNPDRYQDDRTYRLRDSELRFSGNIGGIGWLGGISHLWTKHHLVSTLLSDSASLILDDDHRTITELAAFGNASIPLVPRVTLDVGGRLFRAVTEETRIETQGRTRHKFARNGVTPSFGVSWRPAPNQLVFVRYGSAFRQGGSDILPNGDINRLKGDELAMLEAGWRGDLPGGARFDLGAWYGWWENLQSDVLGPDGLIATENVGNARTFGGELSLVVPVAPRWKLQAGGNFTIARLTRNELGYKLTDRSLPVVPKYTLRGALSHDFTLGQAEGSVSIDLRYVGPARLSFDPQYDRHMGEIFESGAEARFRLRPYSFIVRAENLLALRGDVFAFGNSLRFASMRQYTPQRPFRLSFSMERAF